MNKPRGSAVSAAINASVQRHAALKAARLAYKRRKAAEYRQEVKGDPVYLEALREQQKGYREKGRGE